MTGIAGRVQGDRLVRGDFRAVVFLEAQFVVGDFFQRRDVPGIVQYQLLQKHQGVDMLAAQLQLLGTFKLFQHILWKVTAVAHGVILGKKRRKERKSGRFFILAGNNTTPGGSNTSR